MGKHTPWFGRRPHGQHRTSRCDGPLRCACDGSRELDAVRELAARAPARTRLRGADLARAAGLAPAYFARRFAATVGCAPREWLVAERMRRAATLLLEHDVPIGAIADQLGYGDLFLFSRQFRRAFGVSPRGWRRSVR